jgi:cytosine/adenosine deaminase-related metal-dependent hydrolase
MNVDTLISGATIVTMDETRRVIADGAIAIEGDRIAAIGKRAEIEAAYTATETIDGRRFVATPGFVNGHVHLTETLIRGFLPETLPFGEGLTRWVIPLYEVQTPAEQAIGARLAVLNMLRTGTTTFIEAGTLIAFDEVVEAIADTGIRGVVGRWVLDRAFSPDDNQATLTDTALAALADELAAHPADGRLIAAGPLLIGHNTNTEALWRGAKALADAHGAIISAHMGPVQDDPNWYLANTGRRPVAFLADIGALGPNVNLVHMVHADDAEVALLAATGANVTHCPGAALKGGYGASAVGRFPEMAAAGVNLALGTDGADNHDMMKMVTLMAGLFKDARRDTTIFPAAQALEMATLNGARAMGLQGQIGGLAVGMKADIVLHDTDRPEWVPLHNVVNQLVWSADGRGVHSVWVDGRRVVADYRCTTIDEAAIYAEARAAAAAVIARSGLPATGAWPVS